MGRKADVAAVGVLLAVALGATWPVTVAGKALLPTSLYLRMQPWRAHAREFPEYRGASNPLLDPVQQHYPWRLFAHRAVRSGQVPLWNPHMLCGTPFLGNGQSAVFYPETWLHYLMHPLHALGWATALFLFTAGALMYAFLRTIGVRPTAGLVGAVSFQFNGFFVGWMCFPTMRSVAAWLPLMLIGVEQAARTGRGRWLLLTSIGTGLQFLAGHLHASLYVLMIFGAYTVLRLAALVWPRAGVAAGAMSLAAQSSRASANDASSAQARVRSALGLGVLILGAVALGTMLASAQLAPVIEMTRLSSRTEGVSYQALVGNALAPPQLLLGLMPDIFGNPVDRNHWGAEMNAWWGRSYRSYSETAWYFGAGPLLLALSAVALVRRRQVWFWAGVGLFGLSLAFGGQTNRILYYLIPGYPQLTGIGRAVLMTCSAGAVLAALGAEAMLRRNATQPRADKTLTVIAGALLLCGVLGGLGVWSFTGQLERTLPGIGQYTLVQIVRFAAMLLLSWLVLAWARAGGGRRARLALLVIIVADLTIFMQKFAPEDPVEYALIRPEVAKQVVFPDGPGRVTSIGPDFLNRLSPNTGMLLGWEEVQGSDSLIWGPYDRLLHEISSEEHGLPQVNPALPALDLLNVRYLLTPLEIVSPGWRRVTVWETNLYRNEQALPRAFWTRSLQVHDDEDAVLTAVAAPHADPWVLHLERAALAAPPGGDAAASSPPAGAPAHGTVVVQEYGINYLRLNCTGMQGEGWVVVSNANYPGWRAWADGVPVPIVTGDYALQALHLEGPVRELRLVFLPGSFAVGLFCSLVALSGLAGLAVVCARRCGA